jgi:hypothetical protein
VFVAGFDDLGAGDDDLVPDGLVPLAPDGDQPPTMADIDAAFSLASEELPKSQ